MIQALRPPSASRFCNRIRFADSLDSLMDMIPHRGQGIRRMFELHVKGQLYSLASGTSRSRTAAEGSYVRIDDAQAET